MAARRKNIARKPRMAKMLEKNTTYGSSDTENTAGMLSNANIKSLNSITSTVTKSGVKSRRPALRMKKRSPSNCVCMRPVFESSRTIGFFCTSISSFLLRSRNIFTPLYISTPPNTSSTQSKRLIMAAPRKMNTKRSTIAPRMPQLSTC